MDEGQSNESENSGQPNWQFNDGDDSSTQKNGQDPQAPRQAVIDPIHWTASEYITHQKSAGWYGALTLCSVVAVALVYLLTRDKISAGMVVIVALIFLIVGARKPRVLEYSVDEQGVGIGNNFYPYATFKSFSIVKEAGTESIMLEPLRRFMPSITIYFAPEDGEKIINTIGSYLPHEDRELDLIDSLMHKLRF